MPRIQILELPEGAIDASQHTAPALKAGQHADAC